MLHNSNESSASIHVCIPPSRYSVAYSSGLSIAKAFKVHSEHGVVFSPSSAFPQSIRKHIRQKWLHQYCYGASIRSMNKPNFFRPFFLCFGKFVKAFQSILPVLFISCYNLLQVFLSLIFALMRVRNMREKDITQGKARANSLAINLAFSRVCGLFGDKI